VGLVDDRHVEALQAAGDAGERGVCVHQVDLLEADDVAKLFGHGVGVAGAAVPRELDHSGRPIGKVPGLGLAGEHELLDPAVGELTAELVARTQEFDRRADQVTPMLPSLGNYTGWGRSKRWKN